MISLSAANEKVNVRDRWKEQQARDSRGALEKLSFIDQREREDTDRERERERGCDRVRLEYRASCHNQREKRERKREV